MVNNLVSVITPMYNSEKFIRQSIESVLRQSYKNFELIIVDDGSKDKSEEIVCEYLKKDERIKYIKLEKNMGISNARNIAIKESRGRFIAFLDSDDIWKEDKLNKQVNFMVKNNYSFSFTAYELIDEDNNKLDKIIEARDFYNYKDLLKGNNIGCLTIMLDKKNIDMPIVMKNESHEDYILWLELLRNDINAYGINEVLAYYRKTNSSISHNKFKAAGWTWHIYRKIEKLPIVKSIYYFSNYMINGIRKS
ncbi:MAG: glycosyltransferase family 2 protein [Terrisporobacter sp.]|uniref:glycosyltransferase family 2 protein n=1 Tax=Terrisporobacter sp. TaxID=1965305 RepID=UPI002FC8D694